MLFQSIRRLRHLVYNILQNDEHDTLVSRYVDYFLIALILTNVAAVIAESVDTWYYPYQEYLTLFENFSIVIFSIEYFYVCGVWRTPNLIILHGVSVGTG